MQRNVMLTNTAVKYMLSIQKHQYERNLTHKMVMGDTFTPQDFVGWNAFKHNSPIDPAHPDALGRTSLETSNCHGWYLHAARVGEGIKRTGTQSNMALQYTPCTPKHWDKYHWIKMIVMDDTCTQEHLVKVYNRIELSQTQQSKCYAIRKQQHECHNLICSTLLHPPLVYILYRI